MGIVVGAMIALPPGCTVTYAVWIDVDRLTDEMIEWYRLVGGTVRQDTWYDTRGRAVGILCKLWSWQALSPSSQRHRWHQTTLQW